MSVGTGKPNAGGRGGGAAGPRVGPCWGRPLPHLSLPSVRPRRTGEPPHWGVVRRTQSLNGS